MWSSRLFWKLFLAYGLLYALLAASFVFLEGYRQERLALQQTRDGLQRTARVLASAVAQDLSAAETWKETLVELERDTGLRFTILEPPGRVLADSERDPTDMDDHRSRPEIVAAIEHGTGEAVRRSSTTAAEMLYVAVSLRREGRVVIVVRVASNLKVLREEIHGNRRFLWFTALLVGLVAAPLSYLVVGRIVKPLSQFTEVVSAIARGNYRQPVAMGGRDELGRLGDAFRRMQAELANRIEQLQQYAERLAAVLGGMVEGVLAVDAEQRVILANDAAKSLLGIRSSEIVGRALLEATRNPEIHEAVREALGKGGLCEREVTTTDAARRTLRVLATRLRGEPCSGVLIVLHDVTQLRRLENMRRDFVTNVSHELKTPLSSIKAYAETLRLGAINDPEHNLRFVQRIEEQAQRLHQLIADLLHLARVESGNRPSNSPGSLFWKPLNAVSAISARSRPKTESTCTSNRAAKRSRSGWIAKAWQPFSTTSWTTPSNTRCAAAKSGSAVAAKTRRPFSKSRTRESASQSKIRNESSSGFTAWTRLAPANSAARVSGWPSSSTWRRLLAAKYAW